MPSISEAAAYLGCSVDTIRRRIRSGQLKATKVGNMWDVDLPDNPGLLTPDETGLERIIQVLQQDVEELRRQLGVRELEVGQLHILLGQKALTEGRSAPWWTFWRR